MNSKLKYILLIILVALGLANSQKDLDCEFQQNEVAWSAFERAKSQECKDEIARAACHLQSSNSSRNLLLTNKCPLTPDLNAKLFNVSYGTLMRLISLHDIEHEVLRPKRSLKWCQAICQTNYGHKYVAYSRDKCVCIRHSLNDALADQKRFHTSVELNCSSNHENTCDEVEIYNSGYLGMWCNDTSIT